MRETDLIVALGAIVARELYGAALPIVTVDELAWRRLCAVEGELTVNAFPDGTATLHWRDTWIGCPVAPTADLF